MGKAGYTTRRFQGASVDRDIDLIDVRRICDRHHIDIHAVDVRAGSFGKKVFFINRAILLRASLSPMATEQAKVARVSALESVPKILHAGTLERDEGALHYILLTWLPGDDFETVCPHTTPDQQEQLGAAVAGFLDRLHAVGGPTDVASPRHIDAQRYDIGLYVPTLPGFSGTWREGHRQYIERLSQGLGAVALTAEDRRVIDAALRSVSTLLPALDFQAGPRLLHNDLHPRNILVDQGCFSGVIDWECSQFGEADFDLCHLIHWCLFPARPGQDLRPFLRGLFAALPRCVVVPDLARRLTIYQIEHDLHQIIWNPASAEACRIPRLARWMDGCVEDLLIEIMT